MKGLGFQCLLLGSMWLALLMGCPMWSAGQSGGADLQALEEEVQALLKTQPPLALGRAHDLLTAARATENYSLQSRAYSHLTAGSVRTNQLDSALVFGRLATSLAARSGDSAQMAFAYNALGNAYDATGAADSALASYQQSHALALAVHDTKAVAKALLNIGMEQRTMGRYPESLDALHAAQQRCEQDSIPQFLPNITATMGEVYLLLGEQDRALDYLHMALRYAGPSGNPLTIGRVYLALGGCAEQLGDTAEATCWYATARTFTEAAGVAGLEAKACAFLAKMLQGSGNLAGAEEAILRAVAIAERDHDIISLGLSYMVLGQVSLAQGNATRAFGSCAKAHRVAMETQQWNAIVPVCECLWQSSAQLGKYREAFEFHREAVAWRDSLAGEETAMQIARLEAGLVYARQHAADSAAQVVQEMRVAALHEAELAEERRVRSQTLWAGLGAAALALLGGWFTVTYRRQNRRLEDQNAVISTQNLAIQQALQEKEVLLQEVHHRVKNNLQVMMSLLDLQAERTEDAQARAALLASKGRVQSMSLIHQKLYEQEHIAELEFGAYLQQLVGALQDLFPEGRQVQVAYEMVPAQFGLDVAVPLGLILNELVTNSLKYAFLGRTGGRLQVGLQQGQGGEYVLVVEDDGPGMQDAAMRSGSLGMQLVRGLSRQLRGKCVLDRSPLGGVRAAIHFNPTAA